LLTIVGPGGVGKTRLALEAAHRIAARFADGAFFADLSTVSEGDALSDAISRALGAPTDLASKGFSGIKAFLRNRRALLLLDNCEQIGESCSWFLSDLLESATRVHVIATTRVTFGLRAERCYHLQPLSSSNALELFVDRARHAGSNVEAIARSTERIAAVCRRLDRLPLALELAAGMLGTVSLTDVERQLEAGLEKLRSRDQTLPARHRSLADVIAWSISLLDDHERSAFAKLAVFAGSFSAAAAAGICGVDLPTLGELVAKSVLVREDATEGRFVFLNSVGEYAHRLLDEEPTFWHAEREWLQAIDTDFANAAQALDWSLFGAGAYANGIRLASGLTLYYLRCGFIVDGTFWVRAALERAEPGSLDWAYLSYCLVEFEKSRGQFEPALERAREVRRVFTERGSDREIALAWNCEGACLYRLRRMEEATAAYKRALAFAERSGDVRTEATILINLAFVDGLSDRAAARERFVLALRKAEQIGDESSIAYILASIATYDYGAGHFELAERNLERALATYRALEMIGMVAALVSDLGDVAVMRGEMARARERYAEALELCETHELESTYGSVLSGSAALALESGRPRDAAWLLGAAGLVEDVSKTGAGRRVPERVRQRVEQALGADQCALEVMYGRDLSHKEGTALARSVLASFGDDSKPRLEDRTQD
jgi:predicted ATPase/Flp pilus assembly protein TadD